MFKACVECDVKLWCIVVDAFQFRFCGKCNAYYVMDHTKLSDRFLRVPDKCWRAGRYKMVFGGNEPYDFAVRAALDECMEALAIHRKNSRRDIFYDLSRKTSCFTDERNIMLEILQGRANLKHCCIDGEKERILQMIKDKYSELFGQDEET